MISVPSVEVVAIISAVVLSGCVVAWASPPAEAMPAWPGASPRQVGMDPAKLAQARDYALTGKGSGCIIRAGKLVMAWGDQKRTYDLKSTTKSIGVTALGLALADGKIKSLSDKARKYHPDLGTPPASNTETGHLDKITLLHLATQTAGFEKPGGYGKVLFAPGTKWCYSDGGPNWLAECVTKVYRQDLRDVMFQRVFTPLGITAKDLKWRRNAYRSATIDGITRREFGAGISANVDAMARIGYLYLREGLVGGRQIIPASFVKAARTTPPALKGLEVVGRIGQPEPASGHYGLLWWNNNDAALKNVPTDAYWSWGLYDSFIVVIPSLDLVVARAGKSWQRGGRSDLAVFGSFIGPIVAAVEAAGAPRPPSPVITKLTWAPKETIVRGAAGSDNWPITWADDDALYTAYGDGRGFKPKVKGKLSMGLARVTGPPADFRGVNIRSATGEDKGDGRSGKKASGLLSVDGVLHMWVRNAHKGRQSQLAVSADHGKTWKWQEWRFAEFGYCTFINFGKDYSGARDEYVYTVSHDNPSAYTCADRFILMRVPKDKIVQRDAYEFFKGLDDAGKPVWTTQIAERGSVFDHKGNCRRSGISYDPALKRYLWWQVLGAGDTRRAGGFGVYDAPQPWGPWTTVYFTRKWDVGPGDAGSFPPKWISRDGKTVHLVFSGSDSFSVRQAKLTTAR